MRNKYLILSSFFLAYTLLLGHTIIPHHHHHETLSHEEKVEHHHSYHHHHNHDEESKGVANLFSYFLHADNWVPTSNYQTNLTASFSKLISVIVAVLSNNFFLTDLLTPPLLHSPPWVVSFYCSPFSIISGLRAPPIPIIY